MDNKTTLQKEIRAAFDLYFQLYFNERNYEQVKKLFHSDFCCIGTGKDEVAFLYDDSISLYERDIRQYKDPIPYELNFIKIINITSDVGLVLAGINVDLKIHDMDTRIEGLRMSMIFVKDKENWLLQHLHISKEQDNLEEGEAFPQKEMEEKSRLLQKMVDERTKELNDALEHIKITAITDQLTGLYNRRKFNEIFKQELKNVKENNTTISIILCDVDYFKKVNDNFGHLVGDCVLKEIGNILKLNLRSIDTLARWGGEEFVILLPNTPLKEAVLIAERLRYIIEQAEIQPNFPITMSFGVSEYTTEDTEDSFIKRADDALYFAKNNGRNRVEKM